MIVQYLITQQLSLCLLEWNSCHACSLIPQSITNTFQGILITDGSSSYVVFVYECGGMEWGGGVIGWQASRTDFYTHYLSRRIDSNDVGCLYSSSYSAIVYRLDTC